MKRSVDRELARLLFRHMEERFSPASYSEETRLFRLIQNGDTTISGDLMDAVFNEHNGILSKDPFRQDLYMFICLAAILSRYCIEGGLFTDTAYGLSDLYIQEADACTTSLQIRSLAVKMAEDYAVRMRDIRIHGSSHAYSPHLTRCMNYIEEHLHDPVSVRDLASLCGISADHLSHLFKKEAGISPAAYIRSRRIEAAKILLQYSDLSCSDIAAYLHFSSVSHFGRIFRKITGITPLACRQASRGRALSG